MAHIHAKFRKKKYFKFQMATEAHDTVIILFFVFHLEKRIRIKPLDDLSILTYHK